jgi:metal-responsive CopG/Arc/MetJ family transcriptional regulator
MAMAELQNVRLPEALLAEVRKAAAAQNKSVDEVVQEALQAHLRDREWQEMIAEARERTAKLGIREEDVNDLIAESRREHQERGR